MKIDEASAGLALMLSVYDDWLDNDDIASIKLGIEALERVRADRTLPYPVISDPLPGETKD